MIVFFVSISFESAKGVGNCLIRRARSRKGRTAAESDNTVYRMLPAALRIYPGVASWCWLNSKVLYGDGEWPSSLCWDEVRLCCEIRLTPSVSRF